jgi:hypothetical protein
MPEERTYCIIGQGRGGTSMTAKLVDILGVPLTKTTEVLTEDVEFRKAVFSSNIDEIKVQLEKRNINSVWAWKIPQCGANLANWYKLIRNPFWIYIIRDHLASALTEVRLNVVTNALEGLKIKNDHEQLFYEFISKVNKEKIPVLLISYERVRLHKGEFLMNLIKFLGTKPSVEAIAQAVDFIEEEGPLQKSKITV